MRIKRIHHVTVAVRDIDEARATFEALFGVETTDARSIPVFGVSAANVPVGDGEIELSSPVDLDNPVRRFLERKGEGFYNVAIEVLDLDAAVSELASKGVRVSEPIEAEPGVRSSFVTMAATHGLSIQLVEVTGSPTSTSSEPPREDEGAGEPPVEPRVDLTPDEWSDVD